MQVSQQKTLAMQFHKCSNWECKQMHLNSLPVKTCDPINGKKKTSLTQSEHVCTVHSSNIHLSSNSFRKANARDLQSNPVLFSPLSQSYYSTYSSLLLVITHSANNAPSQVIQILPTTGQQFSAFSFRLLLTYSQYPNPYLRCQAIFCLPPLFRMCNFKDITNITPTKYFFPLQSKAVMGKCHCHFTDTPMSLPFPFYSHFPNSFMMAKLNYIVLHLSKSQGTKPPQHMKILQKLLPYKCGVTHVTCLL